MKKRQSMSKKSKTKSTSKKLESKSTSNNGKSTNSNQKSIKSFFKPCDKSDLVDDNSDIKIISTIKRTHEQLDDDIIIVESNIKKFKIEKSNSRSSFEDQDSAEENHNLINSKQSTSSFQFHEISSVKKESTCNENAAAEDFNCNNNQFETPNKNKVSYTYDLTCASPYFKNFSEALDKNYQDLNNYNKVHLDDINKIKTPTKSEKKSSSSKPIDATSVRKELSFNDSPTKLNQSPTKLNLTNKKELTYSEINRKNFKAILKNVIDDPMNKSLFNEDDWNAISIYTSLSNDSQSLFVRLFLRKNAWIKRASIKYEDFMSNVDELIDELIKSKFLIDTNELSSLEEGLCILDQNEVKEFAKQSKVSIKSNGKQKMIESILEFVRTTKTLTFSTSKFSLEERKLNELTKFLGNRCFKVNMDNSKVFLRILLLYFPPIYFDGNMNKVLTGLL